MSDKMTGIAVLDRASAQPGQPQLLLVNAIYKDGSVRCEDLPVYEKGTAKPAACAWEYTIVGETLNVTPSVRVSTTLPSKADPNVQESVELFHNDGAWSIPFKEFIKGEYQNAYDLFRFLNPKPA